MNNTHYFHFTLGPVQGFVAQARRTRDFWAGSFILSWLSAVAIKAVHVQHPDKPLKDVILFPAPDPNFMLWLEGKGTEKEPTQGSIPNRFKAAIDPNKFDPHAVTNAVKEAWKVLAEKVWKADLAHIKTKDNKNDIQLNIWNRQINNFWEMSWVITPSDVDDSSVLDQRKNWRTYAPTEEPGVKCAMMDGWQELSGEKRPNREAMNENFWGKVLTQGNASMKSDLRPNEALCAIAFVKRRFSRYFHLVEVKLAEKLGFSEEWSAHGWRLPNNIPSAAYMASVYWLHTLVKHADIKKLEAYQNAACSIADQDERALVLPILSPNPKIGLGERAGLFNRLLSCDGNVFFSDELDNEDSFPNLNTNPTKEALKKARESVIINGKVLGESSKFYAILLMDGDSLGAQLRDDDPKMQKIKQKIVTDGLLSFIETVSGIVTKHNGFLIYAGGDDVLALLPLDSAIACTAELRNSYDKCFAEQSIVKMTISAAIEFTHIHTPLTSILQDAHRLLDDVAKEGSGRDALAIRVWKRGGLQLEWSQPWKIILETAKDQDGKEVKVPIINRLVKNFQDNQNKDADFSNKFFYKIRERFALLNPAKDKDRKIISESVLDKEQAISLMTMEYLNSWGSSKNKDLEGAKALVTTLLKQCRPLKRNKDEDDTDKWLQVTKEDLTAEFAKKLGLKDEKNDADKSANHEKLAPIKYWKADGALLVRFLAQKGMEE